MAAAAVVRRVRADGVHHDARREVVVRALKLKLHLKMLLGESRGERLVAKSDLAAKSLVNRVKNGRAERNRVPSHVERNPVEKNGVRLPSLRRPCVLRSLPPKILGPR